MTFKENQERMRKIQEKRIEKIKKQKRIDTILSILIGGFVVITTIMLLGVAGQRQQKSISNCINNGYSYNSCVKGA